MRSDRVGAFTIVRYNLCFLQAVEDFSVEKVPRGVMRLMLLLSGRGTCGVRLYEDLVVDTSKLVATSWYPVVDTFEGLRRMMQSADNKTA